MVLRAFGPVKQGRVAVSNDIVVCNPSRSPLTCASVVISNGSCARAGSAASTSGNAMTAAAEGRSRTGREKTMAAVYRIWMFGLGGAAMPLPMWKLGWGGWL